VQVDPSSHTPGDVGDEALLLARLAPAVVSRDRPAGAELCVSLGASVIVMDDGLQNPSLAKDLRLAVFDAGVGIGNGACLPAGPLRAPMAAQWPVIDAAVIIGEGAQSDALVTEARVRGIPLLAAVLEPDPTAASNIRGRRVLAFAGIGRPEKFFDTLEACGAILAEKISFPDHHAYTGPDLAGLMARARASDLVPATTEKDAVKLASLGSTAELASIQVVPVELAVRDRACVSDLLRRTLDRRRALLGPSL
jgi:tetraacyldisaccharide 4'-kinase